jgi:hypothetical protein
MVDAELASVRFTLEQQATDALVAVAQVSCECRVASYATDDGERE